MSSLPPVPLLRKRTGPPLTWAKAGSSTSPPFNASTWVRELAWVVSAVIVVNAGSETRLPVPLASTTTSAPPMLVRAEAVSVPPPSAWSVVALFCPAGPTRLVRVPMSSLPPVPLLRKRTGPPLTWAKAGSSRSPPFNASTWVRELAWVVSAVIVVNAGSETRLPVPLASTTTSAPPMLVRAEAVSVPPPSAWSVVALFCPAGPTRLVRVPMSSLPPVPLLRKRTGPPLTWAKAGSSMSPLLIASTWVKELVWVVSVVIVASAGRDSTLPAPLAWRTSAAPAGSMQPVRFVKRNVAPPPAYKLPPESVVVPVTVSVTPEPLAVSDPPVMANPPLIVELAATVSPPPEMTQRVGGRDAVDRLDVRADRHGRAGTGDVDDHVVARARNRVGAPVAGHVPGAAGRVDPLNRRQEPAGLQDLHHGTPSD